MKKILSLIIVVLLLVICFLTTPSRAKHESAIAESFKKENTVLGKVGAGFFYSKVLTYKNFYLCSVMMEKNEVKSVGVAGVIFSL